MKSAIKLAVAVAALTISSGASAMPPSVPGIWYSMMEWVMWNSADHRPCNGSITRVCDGQI